MPGQHAVYFAANLPFLQWQCADLPANLPGIRLWLEEAGLPNVLQPLALDVSAAALGITECNYVFSANTAHIMAWPQVESMFAHVGQLLPEGGCFFLYGPFRYNGEYTSPSNAEFDQYLRARDPHSGIRDFESLLALAQRNGLALQVDYAMPANNQSLVWRKQAPASAES